MKRFTKLLAPVFLVGWLIACTLVRQPQTHADRGVPPAATRSGTLEIVGPEEIVVSHEDSDCPQISRTSREYLYIDGPDAPARAFRDAQNQIHLFASNQMNRSFVGRSLDSIERQCESTMPSAKNPDPSAFRDHQWLHSFYTLDGVNVTALIHNEYHGWEYHKDCPEKDPTQRLPPHLCWYASVTFAQSTNGGKTFTMPDAPANVVATLPYRFNTNMGYVGLRNPSNILRNPKDNLYYVMISVSGYGAQSRGTCVLRNPTLEPETWRAWDGKGFNVRFADPYTESITDPKQHVCQPLDIRQQISSVTYNTFLQKFVAVGKALRTNRQDGSELQGAFYSTSDDLIHWETPQILLEAASPYRYEAGDPGSSQYYSLLDPDSPSRNFEVTGQTAFLYYTKFRIENDRATRMRDLVRVPVRFQ